MDETNNSYICPTIAICIEEMDRLTDKEYKFTIPSLNFNMDSSKEEKNEMKNQNITNIANEKNVSIKNIEINNYFMIYVPKELMATCITKAGLSGTLEGSGSNYSSINFRGFDGKGSLSTNILIPPHPDSYYTISQFFIDAIKLGAGSLTGIRQIYDSIKLSLKTSQKDSGVDIMPYDRYINKGSQWIVTFIDGDPSKPAIVARYK